MIPFLLASAVEIAAPNIQPAPITTPNTDPESHPYISVQLGVGFPDDLRGDLNIDGDTYQTRFDLDNGFNGELAVGYRWRHLRTDLSVGYGAFGAATQSFRIPGETVSTSADGSMQYTAVMLNGYIDLPNRLRSGEQSRWRPYLGGGVGYANLSIPDCNFGSGCFAGGSDGAFAWQGKVGLSYRATDRGILFVEAGYLGTGPTQIDRVDFDGFGTWRLNVGWRQGFGGAPKAAAPVAVQLAPQPEPLPQVMPQPQPMPAPAAAPHPIRGLW